MDSKKLVLAAMMVFTTVVVIAAGFASYRHWSWLEEHHLAGLAALQTFFMAVSVVFAAVNLQSEWSELSAGDVVKGYSLAFAIIVGGLLRCWRRAPRAGLVVDVRHGWAVLPVHTPTVRRTGGSWLSSGRLPTGGGA